MNLKKISPSTLIVFLVASLQAQFADAQTFPLNNPQGIEAHGITAEASTFKGKKAVRLVVSSDNLDFRKSMMAKIVGTDFKNGTIEVEVASQPADNAPEGSRGFAGIAFRMTDEFKTYECLYIRPTNGRADDQLRRNHSTQYVSHPEYPWYRLREETPGVYESYVDLQPGVWTKLKVEVMDGKGTFYVNGSEQPVLIVNDLKHGPDQHGPVALWIGSGTEAYYANLKITPR